MTRCRKSVPGRGNSPCKGLVTGVPGVSQGGQCAQESPSAKQGGPGADGTRAGTDLSRWLAPAFKSPAGCHEEQEMVLSFFFKKNICSFGYPRSSCNMWDLVP